MRRWRYSTNL